MIRALLYGGERDERAAGEHRQHRAQPGQREHDRVQEVAASSSRTSSTSRSRRPGTPSSRRARRRSASRPGSARAPWRRRATSRAATCARPARRSTSPSKAHGFFQVSLPGGETGYTRAGMFHVNGQGDVVTNEGYPLEPAITHSRQRHVGHDLEGRHRLGRRVPGQGTPQQVGTHRARAVPEPGRPRGARRQRLRRHQRARAIRPRACPAPTGSARWCRGSSRTRTSASSRRWST